MLTGNGNRSFVNSGRQLGYSGNRALKREIVELSRVRDEWDRRLRWINSSSMLHRFVAGERICLHNFYKKGNLVILCIISRASNRNFAMSYEEILLLLLLLFCRVTTIIRQGQKCYEREKSPPEQECTHRVRFEPTPYCSCQCRYLANNNEALL